MVRNRERRGEKTRSRCSRVSINKASTTNAGVFNPKYSKGRYIESNRRGDTIVKTNDPTRPYSVVDNTNKFQRRFHSKQNARNYMNA